MNLWWRGLGFTALALALCGAPTCANAQDLMKRLAGQSLNADVTYHISVRDPTFGLPMSTSVTLSLRVYFSSKGRLFSYFGGRQDSGGSYQKKNVLTSGMVERDPEMGVNAVWFVGTNDLTRTIDFGNLQQIYRVNVSGTGSSVSCEVLFVFDKKGSGPHHIPNMQTRRPVEFISYKLQSKSCRISPGNVFAPGDL